MANKKTIKRILIEKRILLYISTRLDIKSVTVLDLTKELKEFSNYKYLKRTIWVIMKSLLDEEIVEKIGDKEFGADCYSVINNVKLLTRIKDLENRPILVKKNIIQYVQPEQRIALTSTDVGRNIIAYVNEVEEKYYGTLKRIEELEKNIKLLEREILDHKLSFKPSLSVNKIPAGEKMFVFKK